MFQVPRGILSLSLMSFDLLQCSEQSEPVKIPQLRMGNYMWALVRKVNDYYRPAVSRTSSAVPNGLCGDFIAPRHDSEYVSEYYTVQPFLFREVKVGACVVHY